MNQRLAHLEPLMGEACIGSTMRYLNALLSWIAIALLWGFVAAFGASYAGKQLMVLKGIGQAEGFFFIDRVNEARAANNNQPLMGLLLLPALLFMLSGPAAVDLSLPEFDFPSFELELELALGQDEADGAFDEGAGATAEEESQPRTYVLEGPSRHKSLWGELAAKFGAANVEAITTLNKITGSDHVAGREVIIPEGMELP